MSPIPRAWRSCTGRAFRIWSHSGAGFGGGPPWLGDSPKCRISAASVAKPTQPSRFSGAVFAWNPPTALASRVASGRPGAQLLVQPFEIVGAQVVEADDLVLGVRPDLEIRDPRI
jgi:hypothetical protein